MSGLETAAAVVGITDVALRAQIRQQTEEAKTARARAEKAEEELRELSHEDDEDADLVVALQQTEAAKVAYEQLWANCQVAASELRSVQLDQEIGNVKAGDEAELDVGVPETVMEKVRRQRIGDVEVGTKAKVSVGIHRAKR